MLGEQAAARPRAYGRASICALACACLAGAAAVNFLPWILALWGTSPESLSESYTAVFYLQMPSLFLLEHSPLPPLWGWEGPSRAAQLAAGGGALAARAGHLLVLLVHWLPWALLLGAVLALRPRTANGLGERRLLLRGLAWTDLPWWVLFFLAAPLREVAWINFAAFYLALPAAKLAQTYLVLRAALFQRASPGKCLLLGLLAGLPLVYWLPFLLLNEEFLRAEELRQARAARGEGGESGPTA